MMIWVPGRALKFPSRKGATQTKAWRCETTAVCLIFVPLFVHSCSLVPLEKPTKDELFLFASRNSLQGLIRDGCQDRFTHNTQKQQTSR